MRPTYEELESALKAKEEEIEISHEHCRKVGAEHRYEVATLKEAMNVTICVWCGHKGKKDALELLTHVQECSKHPLGKSLKLIEVLESQLKDKDARIAELEARP